MVSVKIVALLALAFVVSATDLEDGMAIMACARRAINGGVPELNIPTHDPYVVINHNFTWQGDLFMFSNTKISIHDLTWAGLGTWELTAIQRSKDTDKNAVFNFVLYWEKMELTCKYEAEENAAIIRTEQYGALYVDMKESTWKGSIDLTKPTELSNGTVNSVKIDWHVEDVSVIVNGLGVLDIPFEETVSNTFKTALNNRLIGNAIGDFIKMRLETIWWNTGKVWELVQWCKDNPEDSTDY